MAALDFILALEWPCRDHVKHNLLSLSDEDRADAAADGFNGHALTATQAVLCSAQCLPVDADAAPNVPRLHLEDEVSRGELSTWMLPHSEIDK